MAKSVHFVLLNGPPSSGKTTIARELVRALNDAYAGGHVSHTIQDSFAAPMKHYIAMALGEKYADMNKERPNAVLRGHSIREFMIYEGEDHMKKHYGEDIFGRLLLHRVMRNVPLPDYVVVDDLGFVEELDAVRPHTVVRIMRDGKDYKQDSRSYLDAPDYTFDNNGDMATMWGRTKKLASDILVARHIK